MDFREILVKCR